MQELMRYSPQLIDAELVNNEQRTINELLFDCSGSMLGEPIREATAGMHLYRREVCADPVARQRIEPAVIEFGGDVRLHPFVTADQFQVPNLSAGGNTPMGEAIMKGLDHLRGRVQQLNEQGIPYTRPLVFLITDGEPTDHWQAAATRVHEEDAQKLIAFFAIGVRDANMDILRAIAPPTRPPQKLDGLKFTDFFMWLSTNAIRASQTSVGQQVALTPASTWRAI